MQNLKLSEVIQALKNLPYEEVDSLALHLSQGTDGFSTFMKLSSIRDGKAHIIKLLECTVENFGDMHVEFEGGSEDYQVKGECHHAELEEAIKRLRNL